MKVTIVALTLLLSGCCAGSKDAYTLYRTSVGDDSARMHVATFDTDEGDKYNQENCELGKNLFQSQPGVIVRFFCEKGNYRK